jgi:hypothetical protein
MCLSPCLQQNEDHPMFDREPMAISPNTFEAHARLRAVLTGIGRALASCRSAGGQTAAQSGDRQSRSGSSRRPNDRQAAHRAEPTDEITWGNGTTNPLRHPRGTGPQPK